MNHGDFQIERCPLSYRTDVPARVIEIEAIEEQWRTESAELVTAVGRLQDENKRLRRTINAPADGTSAPPSPAREHDQEVLSRLSSTAEKQRATLRHQESQLQEKQQVIDGLTSQVEKLAQVSRDLRRKHKQLQNQMRLVCEERSELTAIVQSQQRDIATLQQVNVQNQKCKTCGAPTPDGGDETDQASNRTFSEHELLAILQERNELKLKLNRAEEQLQALQVEPQQDRLVKDMRLVCEERSELTAIVQSQQRDIATLQQVNVQNQKCKTCGAPTPDGGDETDQASNRTFSEHELLAILQERNELKLKLNRAEEQLQALQVEPQQDSGSDTSPSMSTVASTAEEDEAPVQGPLPAEPDDAPWKRNSGIRKFGSDTSPSMSTVASTAEEDEAPVQGPLPAEPDDAPWKRNSGIRKFFRKLFVESDITVGSFPRRSLNSFASKMSAPGGPPTAPA
ncbi:RILP-like protein homolog [Ostrinia furnacalis]|uniref:RILP-like protein homolog n=1 Tax=Ostrinia furnacalis TaxID=93504 RepID=UPI00103D6179|nr:RILP-like protein homolog [Ostrinia furnacalis]